MQSYILIVTDLDISKKRDLDSSKTGTMNTNRTMDHGAMKRQGNQSNRNPQDFLHLVNLQSLQKKK